MCDFIRNAETVLGNKPILQTTKHFIRQCVGFFIKKTPLKNDYVDSYEGNLLTFEKKYLHTEKIEESQKYRICWVTICRSKCHHPVM